MIFMRGISVRETKKGIAFARDGESMVGFSCVDFGKTGSDTGLQLIFLH